MHPLQSYVNVYDEPVTEQMYSSRQICNQSNKLMLYYDRSWSSLNLARQNVEHILIHPAGQTVSQNLVKFPQCKKLTAQNIPKGYRHGGTDQKPSCTYTA